MPARVTLTIDSGLFAGKSFSFEAPDRLLFGRHRDCQISLPNDGFVSRHHFLLEVNPPHIALRDLGSTNGTVVNGRKITGVKPSSGAPADAAGVVELRDGDIVEVGKTRMRIVIYSPTRCGMCSVELPEGSTGAVCDACVKREGTVAWSSPTPNKGPATAPPSGGVARLLESLSEKYVVGAELGRGGMGVVYAAQEKTGRPVAIKILTQPIDEEDVAVKRFLREIEIGMSLSHPRIVRLLDHGSRAGRMYFVMEHCDAGSVERLLERGGPLPLDKATRLMLKCLEGMAFAHDKDMIHRDLKPANILMQRGDDGRLRPKIADFGLAKSLQTHGLSGMTMTGVFGGTWSYMPREQVTNFKRLSPATDVWSLGAILFRLLTKQLPREFPPDRDPIEVVLQDDARPITSVAPHLPSRLAEVVDRSLATDPAKRFATAREMLDALNVAR